MTAFQRARSAEQRAVRRDTILQTAAAMLAEMPVSALSLNELGRRAGMAKSNVLRYFESREAVLLDLLDQSSADFLQKVTRTLPASVDPATEVNTRAHAVASGLAKAFAADPILCHLLSAQANILEHNVSVEVATRIKLGARTNLTGLAELIRSQVPELDEQRSARAASLIILITAALWPYTNPAPAVAAAYRADTSLQFLRSPFAEALDHAIATILIGLVAGDPPADTLRPRRPGSRAAAPGRRSRR